MPSSIKQSRYNWISPVLILTTLAVILVFHLSYHYLIIALAILLFVQIISDRTALFGTFRKIPANAITLIRLILVLTLLGSFEQLKQGTLAILYLLAAASDGLDGYLARRYNADSSEGAALDEAVDAVYLISLSLVLMEYQVFDAWILIPVLLRECWVLVKPLLTAETVQLKFGFAKWIAAISFSLLPLCFIIPSVYAQIIGVSVVCAFSFSFTLEAYFVMKN